ncbi:thioredoxin domain-containing protein [Homoserinibacter sp. GY 40078]|uniref:DsbA family protein n=1 Tax=Homoserinibacter sp. GY 40078 TaxID=2603275 RepID=UPI0011C9503B|nr:thioredoxin domain-containing protein [Homoserinibacter sp. GY 40078]TXK18895.1 thioredoxin domain-containing protein [Homoserinibacter sp. GY 40078]
MSAVRTSRSTRAVVIVTAVLLVAIAAVIIALVATRTPASSPASAPVDDTSLIGDAPLFLAEGESLVLVEFGDYQCPSCQALAPAVASLETEFPDQVTVVYRHFPLPQHAHAIDAALAAEAAAAQGRFVEMHEALYASQAEWSELDDAAPAFRAIAEQLGLDLDRYDADVADPDTRARVEADAAAGDAAGVSSTPTFFLEGEKLELQKITDLRDAVAAALG